MGANAILKQMHQPCTVIIKTKKGGKILKLDFDTFTQALTNTRGRLQDQFEDKLVERIHGKKKRK